LIFLEHSALRKQKRRRVTTHAPCRFRISRLRSRRRKCRNDQNESAGNGDKAGKGGVPGQRIVVAAYRNPFGSLKVLQPNHGYELRALRQFSPTSPR
jgi:hypothetical protein